MNSGLLQYAARGRAFRSIGTHQKFDREAFRLISPLVDHTKFPRRRDILKFEGLGGPDGLKLKGDYNTSHMWDPVNEIGHLPVWIESHHKNMAAALKRGDIVEASFHAGWMAHYLTDSMTPAHHISHELVTAEYKDAGKLRYSWLYWGSKGLMSTHVAFEMGVSSAVFFSPIRSKYDAKLTQKIAANGLAAVVKEESLQVAKLGLYDRFLKKGWTTDLAKAMKSQVIPRTTQLIAAAWASAYDTAGFKLAEKKR